MPGKVNPVIPELVNQIAFEVIGNDLTVCMAAEAGQLQLNAFEPVIALALFRSLEHLAAGCRTLQTRCIAGSLAREAQETGRCVAELVLERRLMGAAQLDAALLPERLTGQLL